MDSTRVVGDEMKRIGITLAATVLVNLWNASPDERDDIGRYVIDEPIEDALDQLAVEIGPRAAHIVTIGRPSLMSRLPSRAALVALLQDGQTKADLARTFGVSRPTLDRRLDARWGK